MRRVRLCALALLVAASCAGEPPERPAPEGAFASLSSVSVDSPQPAAPAFAISLEGEDPDPAAATTWEVEGVNVVAVLTVASARVTGNGRSRSLRVGWVDPLDLRPLSPAGTREPDYVWTSLLGGEAVVTFRVAEELGLGPGSELDIAGIPRVDVGAAADPGPADFADVLLGNGVGRATGDPHH